jgi:hypothetical protein
MPDTAPEGAGEDSAWIAVPTALTPEQLAVLVDDPERLLRVNPCWVFEAWERSGPDRFTLRVRDTVHDRRWAADGSIERLPDGLRLVYDDGLKASTRLRVEHGDAGTRLWVIDDYSRLPAAEREARLDEVDRSLPAWGRALERYLAGWHRWGHNRAWRWYMERWWRRMTPLARRVARLLLWATVIEFVVFLVLIAVLVAERGGQGAGARTGASVIDEGGAHARGVESTSRNSRIPFR